MKQSIQWKYINVNDRWLSVTYVNFVSLQFVNWQDDKDKILNINN